LTIDPLLASEHRAHHRDPRNIALIFIPAKALLWVLPNTVAIAVLAFPRLPMGLTYLVFISALGLCYEWSHYLIHSDDKPKLVCTVPFGVTIGAITTRTSTTGSQ
jgi:hypothetical protein